MRSLPVSDRAACAIAPSGSASKDCGRLDFDGVGFGVAGTGALCVAEADVAGAGDGTVLFATCSIRAFKQVNGNAVCTFSNFICGCVAVADHLPLAAAASSSLTAAASSYGCFRFPFPIGVQTSMQYDTASLGQKGYGNGLVFLLVRRSEVRGQRSRSEVGGRRARWFGSKNS